MEVKIGVQQALRELTVETDLTAEAVQTLIADAVSSNGVFSLADAKGRTVIVPAAKIAYIEIGAATIGTVGFRS